MSKHIGDHYIFILDCSGSMTDSLPQLRRHLKNKLSTIINPNDCISIIWFSGINEFGSVFEKIMLHDASMLRKVHDAIDRWLVPKGLTGFFKPLQLALSLAQSSPEFANNLILQTDGYDNQSDLDDVLAICRNDISKVFQNKTILEYGYYCNHEFLENMSQAMDAGHQFSQQCEDLCQKLDDSLAISGQGAHKVNLQHRLKSPHDRVMYLRNHDVIIIRPPARTITVPDETTILYDYNIEATIGPCDEISSRTIEPYLYIYADHKEGKSDRVYDRIFALGDKRLIRLYTNAFSKQEIILFEESLKECIINQEVRCIEGFDTGLQPNVNAFTVLDFLRLLVTPDMECYVEPSSLLNYKRISAGKKRTNDDDDDDGGDDDDNAKKEEKLKYCDESMTEPYRLTNLVFHEHRANVTLHLEREIQVLVPSTAQDQYSLPEKITTKQHKSISVLCDGIMHFCQLTLYLPLDWKNHFPMDQLPLDCIVGDRMTRSGKTQEFKWKNSNRTFARVSVNLQLLPLINRTMMSQPLNDSTIVNYLKLLECKAQLKVLRQLNRQQGATTTESHSTIDWPFDEDATSWLKQNGLSKSGYQPPSKVQKSADYYLTREVKLKCAGCMTLPTVEAALKSKKASLVYDWMKSTHTLWVDQKPEEILKELNRINALKEEYYNHWIQVVYQLVVGTKLLSDTLDTKHWDIDYQNYKVACDLDIAETKVHL